MFDKETKDRYIGIVNVLGDESVATSFKEFLLSFDSPHEKELHLFVANFISLLIEYKELKIKASGYEELMESNDLTALQIKNIKKRFEALSRGEIPVMPVSKMQEDEVSAS